MLPNAAFWRGKRVLLTGHTGFKGAWLALWLQRLGVEVTGIALAPATQPSLFGLLGLDRWMPGHTCDIRNAAELKSLVGAARPEIVLHLAAQTLVRVGYQQPQETFGTNVMGTVNLLDALRDVDSVRVVVAVTTDKVYQNREWPYPYREEDALGGHDPYSASKAAAELVIASYRVSFLGLAGVAVASARAGNVIGGGDWAADRLIPDAIRAWNANQPLQIRRPQAIRPWQHVLEPLAGYIKLAEQLWQQPSVAALDAGHPPRTGGGHHDSAGAVGDVSGHELLEHRAAQDFTGLADHCAGPAGGRRHHCGGNDGAQDGGGLRQSARRHLRL